MVRSTGFNVLATKQLIFIIYIIAKTRILLCRAFVPSEDVVKSFDTLLLHLPTELEEIFDYFKDHYMGS